MEVTVNSSDMLEMIGMFFCCGLLPCALIVIALFSRSEANYGDEKWK